MYTTMEKFDTLLAEFHRSQDEVRQFRWEVKEKFDASVAEVKREVNQAQEKTSLEVARKIGNSMYQFKKKGHKHQYRFNCKVVEAISSAQADLSKLKPTNPTEKTALDSAGTKGMKVLATRQKHIKIADHSEHVWGTVAHYQEDPLASNPEDDKEIERAENKAEKDAKREAEKV